MNITKVFRQLISVVAFTLIAGGLVVGPTAAQVVLTSAPAGDFVPVSPIRVVDTRIGLGETRINPNSSVTINFGSVVPASARAVALNVTAVQPTNDTFLTLWPAGEPRPLSSNLNPQAGDTRANAAIVGLGANRSISIFNNRGSTDIVVDLTGYFVSGFTGVIPTRLMDTRMGVGGAVFGPATERSIQVVGVAGVPLNAAAVAINITATESSRGTYLTAYPTGALRPLASTLNVVTGQTAANFAVVRVGAGGKITLYSDRGSVQGIIDVFGWFDGSGNLNPMTPLRVLDTRNGTCGVRLGQGETRTVNVGRTDSSAVLVNVTAVEATHSTYVTVFPAGIPMPNTSNLNPMNADAVPNMVLVGTGSAGEISIYNHRGTVEIIVDVLGFFNGSVRSGNPTRCSGAPRQSLDAAVVAHGTGMTLREAQMSIDIFDRVNRERSARGIPSLQWDMEVAASSYRWSKQMVISGYEHDDLDRVRRELNSNIQGIGENIHSPMSGNEALCFGSPDHPQAACGHLDWMKSDGHRYNLLNPYFTAAGFGIFCLPAANFQWYGTQRFVYRYGELSASEIERRRVLEPRALPRDPIVAAEPNGLRCH